MPICYNIATGKYVPEENWDSLCTLIKEWIPQTQGLKLVDGPGCANLGVCLTEDNEKAIRDLTIALMPSRYCLVKDDPWEGNTYKLTPPPKEDR